MIAYGPEYEVVLFSGVLFTAITPCVAFTAFLPALVPEDHLPLLQNRSSIFLDSTLKKSASCAALVRELFSSLFRCSCRLACSISAFTGQADRVIRDPDPLDCYFGYSLPKHVALSRSRSAYPENFVSAILQPLVGLQQMLSICTHRLINKLLFGLLVLYYLVEECQPCCI
eukprot:IDg14173t1